MNVILFYKSIFEEIVEVEPVYFDNHKYKIDGSVNCSIHILDDPENNNIKTDNEDTDYLIKDRDENNIEMQGFLCPSLLKVNQIIDSRMFISKDKANIFYILIFTIVVAQLIYLSKPKFFHIKYKLDASFIIQ